MNASPNYLKALPRDLSAGLVVFLVALPLCLGVALASNAPLISGIVAGVVGGVLVAWVSGSHTSISGPAAGLTAIVATQIQQSGSFDAFLIAVIIAGVLQIGLGVLRAGSLAAFFPSSVIKGLLAAIGIILILKQIPHLFGHDPDWLGDLSFMQRDGENTFSALIDTLFDVHPGATVIGLASLALLLLWDRIRFLKQSPIPSPLVVVVGGVLLVLGLESLGGPWIVGGAHLVQVPVPDSLAGFVTEMHSPDVRAIGNSSIWIAAVTIAIVATLETLLNLEAVDKIDPEKRVSPPNRELVAQGVGNMTSGLLGGLPITSVVVRSSVGIAAGAKTRVASFIHGALLLGMVLLLPGLLNRIPLACLAAVLMVTGYKLATPALFRQMRSQGLNQFLPFLATIGAIVFTDLLLGILIGLSVAVVFILKSNLNAPIRKIQEHHASGDVMRIELASQVSFLNRAALLEALHGLAPESQVVLDARNTEYMDPDIVDLIRDFEHETAPAHQIGLSLLGFRDRYDFEDRITYVDVSTREFQERVGPDHVLSLLKAGNARFVRGETISRDARRQVGATSSAQYPLAVVLACIDSRIATEMIFDLGLGDVFSVRVAGNIAAKASLGSMEYGCAVAGAKLLLVLGHTRCGAVTSTIDLLAEGNGEVAPTGFDNLDSITTVIAESIRAETTTHSERNARNQAFVDSVAATNVRCTMDEIRAKSTTLRALVDRGEVMLVGALYDVSTGRVTFLDSSEEEVA